MTIYIKKARANNKTKDNEFRKEKFTYEAKKDVYIYPAGKEMPFLKTRQKTE